MVKKREPNINTKKLLMIIVGIVVLIVAVAVGIFMSQSKAEKSNEDIDIKEPTKIAIDQILEYGEDIVEKTFTIHMEDETKEANFADLNPEVDTMKVGKTEHELELDGDKFEVTIIVEDTQNPVIKGVKETIELEGEKVDVEKELAKMITAEDPVDGELEVTFIIEKKEDKENEYNVTAEATDNNENKTTEKFEVIVKIEEKKEEAKKSNEDSKSTASNSNNKSINSNSSSSSTSKSETKAPSKPKQEKPNKSGESTPDSSNVGPTINGPKGSLPSGSSLTKKENSSHTYAYRKNLPGGGSISEVIVSVESGENTVYIRGVDTNGNEFTGVYSPAKLDIVYLYSLPATTSDGFTTISDVGAEFAVAYGWQDVYRMMELNIFSGDTVEYYAANTNSKTLGEEIDAYNKYNEPKFILKKTNGGRIIHSFNNEENNDKYEWIITSEDCKGGVCPKNIDSIKLDKPKSFVIMYVEK